MIDREIIEECKKGNLQNFRELVRMVSPFAFSVAFRILGDEETAKDIVQESLITVWKKLKKIRSSDRPPGAWIIREDGTLVPDMSDEATRARLGVDNKSEIKKEEKHELQLGADSRKNRK